MNMSSENNFKTRDRLKVWSIVAAACMLLSFLLSFGGYLKYGIKLNVTVAMNIISMIVGVLPGIALTLYATSYREEWKNNGVIAAVCWLIAATPTIVVLTGLINGHFGIGRIYTLVFIAAFVIMGLNAYKDRINNRYVVIVVLVGIFMELLQVNQLLEDWGLYMNYELELAASLIGSVGAVALYVALLILHGLDDKIIRGTKSFVKSLKEKPAKEITPEEELTALKDKLELGLISEEEYAALRAEVIDKL